MGNLTLCEALAGGAFDRVNDSHDRGFDHNFSKKTNARRFASPGGWALFELTDTLLRYRMKLSSDLIMRELFLR